MKTLAWIVTPDAPRRLLAEPLKKSSKMGGRELARVLAAAHKKGWIRLAGGVDGHPQDVRAVIQEHFNARDITKCRMHGNENVR